tara:strand:+ start:878 stop:1114 length:237 start_codon:yes stop_codon:yes gene_type:complete
MKINLDLNKADSFVKEIEIIVDKYNMDYLEAILYYCDIHSMEEDQIAQFVVGPLKERLAKEARSLNLISKNDALSLPL